MRRRAWLVVAILGVAAAGMACSDGDSEPVPGSVEDFEAFVDELADQSGADLAEAIQGRLLARPIDCADIYPEWDLWIEGCSNGESAAEAVLGGLWKSQGVYYTADEARAALNHLVDDGLPDESDQFGDGTLSVAAMSIAEGPIGNATILQAIAERPDNFAGSGPMRVATSYQWEFYDGEWRAVSFMSASFLGPEFLEPTDEVRELLFPNWEQVN